MFHAPDGETLRLCSVLSSTAFGLVFAFVRFAGPGERYCLHWSASALLYAAVLVAFELLPGLPAVKSVLLGVLAATNMLIISGLRAFDRKPPFSWWMLLPVSSCIATHLLPAIIAKGNPHALLMTEIGDTLSIAASALIAGVACLTAQSHSSDATEWDVVAIPSRGRRLAGLALMGYLPCYAITLISYLSIGPRSNFLALIPLLSDQLLLAVLNLGLLAMPAERAAAHLRDAALRDPLTRVWNRAGFELHSLPLVQAGATVLAIDVDHFKQINDRHGHAAGDKVLETLARVASSEIRALGGVFGRLGGDEFIAVLPASRASYAQACAQQIHNACRRAADPMTEWSISVGLSKIELGETSFRDALQRADHALYRAKVDGRDKLVA
jgi:diguanylate cyclase (GGDEF)-like protein